ncbi:MAG: MFS transporter [Gemmatimonadetes bacterium]|nr:MFS transporter [Gemmatimonadota bacterium]
MQVGAATTSSAVDTLMALTAAPEDKGRAAGFKMAGNVGGIGLLGALQIWMASNTTAATTGLVMVAIVLATAACGLFIGDEPPTAHVVHSGSLVAHAWARVVAILTDLWATVRSRDGWTGLVMCAAPVGAGALVNLLSGLAPAYHASEDVVAMINGLGGGLTAAAGAIVGGFFVDRMNRRVAYCLFAGCTALCALAMAAAPMTPTTFAAGSLAYRFFNGITMAAFAGMILEMVAHGRAVATTFTLFVAVSNQAISVVTYLDGQGSAFRNLGATGTVLTDAGLTFLGIVIVALMAWWLRGRRVPAVLPRAPSAAAPR